MSPRTKAQFEEIRDSRKKQIMATALDLFSLEGYGHVSISRLAEATGISKGLMYNYFDSKEMLLQSLVHDGLEKISGVFDPNQDGVLSGEEFEFFIRRTFQLIRENQEYWSKFFGLILQPNVSSHLRNNPVVTFIEDYMNILFAYLEKKGFDDPMLELLQLSAIIEGLGVLMLYSRGYMTLPEDTLEKFENRIINMYK
jgi:AcrR family transcriptional regulator